MTEGSDLRKTEKRLLGQFEQAFVLTDRAFGLVVVSVLRLRRGPQPDVLRRALSLVQTRHPLLRTRIVARRKTFAFAPMPREAPISLSVRERQADDHWRRAAQQELNQPFDPDQGPLMRCVYLVSKDHAADLLCVFHHAIMDGFSCMHLLHELLVQCAVLRGEAEPDQEQERASVLLPPTDKLLPPAYSGWRRIRRAIPFVLRQMREEQRYRRETRDRHQPPLHPSSACHVHTLSLPEAATQALVKKSRREQVTLNSAVVAALLLGVYRRRYPAEARPLQALVFSNLRPYLHPAPGPENLGCYISMQRTAVLLTPDDTLWTVARLLNAAIYTANKRGEKFLAALLSKRVMQQTLRNQNERMATVASSYVGPLTLKPAYGSIEVSDVHGFITANRLSPEYSAFGHLFRNRLTLDFMYLAADMDPRQAHALADEIKQILCV